jgi:hypothetical protein
MCPFRLMWIDGKESAKPPWILHEESRLDNQATLFQEQQTLAHSLILIENQGEELYTCNHLTWVATKWCDTTCMLLVTWVRVRTEYPSVVLVTALVVWLWVFSPCHFITVKENVEESTRSVVQFRRWKNADSETYREGERGKRPSFNSLAHQEIRILS